MTLIAAWLVLQLIDPHRQVHLQRWLTFGANSRGVRSSSGEPGPTMRCCLTPSTTWCTCAHPLLAAELSDRGYDPVHTTAFTAVGYPLASPQRVNSDREHGVSAGCSIGRTTALCWQAVQKRGRDARACTWCRSSKSSASPCRRSVHADGPIMLRVS